MDIDLSTIPQTWRQARLKDAALFTKKPRRFKLTAPHVRFLPMALIPIGQTFTTEFEERPTEQLGSGTYIEDGDVLVTKITPCFENGKQAIARLGAPFGYATTEVIPLRGQPNLTDTLFLHYVLLHPRLRNSLASQMDGSTNRQRLRKEILQEKVIPVPPLSEQQKIAALLAAVQRAIEQQERLISLTTELKKALMHKLFTEGTRGEPQKQTDIGPVPESWKIVPLSFLLADSLQNGAFIKKPVMGRGFLFANVVDMYQEVYLNFSQLERIEVLENEIAQYFLNEGDLLVVRSSLKREGIGQNCIAKNLPERVFYDCHLIRVVPHTDRIISEYLSYFWRSSVGKEDLIRRSKTTTMTTINQQSLSSALVPVAERSEQIEIAGSLQSADAKIVAHRAIRDSYYDLFRTLLHQLMTAQVRVNDLDLSALCHDPVAAGAEEDV